MTNQSFSNISNSLQLSRVVILTPAEFFRAMPRIGGFVEPVTFLLVMTIIAGAFQIIGNLFSLGQFSQFSNFVQGPLSVIFLPFEAIFYGFVASLFTFAIWKLLGSAESFETTFRCIAYSSAVIPIATIIGMLPYLGSVIWTGWMALILFYASIEVHSIKSSSAKFWLFILALLFGLINLMEEYSNRRFHEFGVFSYQPGKSETRDFGAEHKTPEAVNKVVSDFLKDIDEIYRNESAED